MTLPDLGPERPLPSSETREMVERKRTEPGASMAMRGSTFWIALLVIAAAIAVFALLLRF